MPGTAVDQRGLSVSCSRLSWERSWGCCWPCCPQSRRRPHSARRFPEGRTGAISLLVAGESPVRPVSPSLHGDRGKACRMYKKARRSLLRRAFYRFLPPWRSRAGRPVPLFPGGSGEGVKSPFSFPPSCKPRGRAGRRGKGRGDVLPFPQPSSPFSFSCSRAALEAPMPGRRRRSSRLAVRMASRLPKVSQSRRAVAGPMPGRRMSSPERAA